MRASHLRYLLGSLAFIGLLIHSLFWPAPATCADVFVAAAILYVMLGDEPKEGR